MNKFLDEMNKTAETENGAKSYVSTKSELVNQFSNAGTFKNRDIVSVFRDQELLKHMTEKEYIIFPMYLRLISRKICFANGMKTSCVQKGQGLRDESFKRFLYIAKNDKKLFYDNLYLLPVIGSWKDLWEIMYYDIIYGINTINHKLIFKAIVNGLTMENQCELIKKYLPRIQSRQKCKTERSKLMNRFAKEFCAFMKISAEEYRTLKSSGTAHKFQQDICAGIDVNFSEIPGRALMLLANGKYLSNHNLEDKFTEFIKNTNIVKFTGYPYELVKSFEAKAGVIKPYETYLINKQFENIVSKAKDNGKIDGNVLCCLDTSGSMDWSEYYSSNVTPKQIALSLAILFSSLNNGSFKDTILMFDTISQLVKLNGETFCDKLQEIKRNKLYGSCGGGTNFQGAIDRIIDVRRLHPEIPLEDFPKTLLTISDMQFNPTNGNEKTNLEAMKEKLYEAFPKSFVDDMKFIWWQVSNRTTDFPSTIDDAGSIMLSGFDGSIIDLLLGEKVKEKQSFDMISSIEKIFSQEIFNYIKF
jgi:ABC-type sugar transport system ATPase subunit